MSSASITIVIPVRNMSSLLDGCLTSLEPELKTYDEVIVVDDASTDRTADVARRHRATVLSTTISRGPYVARQMAAMSATTELILFIDARSRPQMGLLDAHRALLRKRGVALSCTRTVIDPGPSVAARVIALSRLFDPELKVDTAGEAEWYPTANLGMTTRAFKKVGGFRNMKSGGDRDICVRIKAGKLGTLEVDWRPLMRWLPRTSIRDLIEQWWRYGQSAAYLDRLYATYPLIPTIEDRKPVMADGRVENRRNISARLEALKRAEDRPALLALGLLDLLRACSYRWHSSKSDSVVEPLLIDLGGNFAA